MIQPRWQWCSPDATQVQPNSRQIGQAIPGPAQEVIVLPHYCPGFPVQIVTVLSKKIKSPGIWRLSLIINNYSARVQMSPGAPTWPKVVGSLPAVCRHCAAAYPRFYPQWLIREPAGANSANGTLPEGRGVSAPWFSHHRYGWSGIQVLQNGCDFGNGNSP